MAATDITSTVSVPPQCAPLHARHGRRLMVTMYTIVFDIIVLWIGIASSDLESDGGDVTEVTSRWGKEKREEVESKSGFALCI